MVLISAQSHSIIYLSGQSGLGQSRTARQDHSLQLSDPATANAFCEDVVGNFEWLEELCQLHHYLIKTSLNKNVPKLTYAKRPVPRLIQIFTNSAAAISPVALECSRTLLLTTKLMYLPSP